MGWGLGINFGPTPRVLAGLRARLGQLARLEGGRVSVVGVSLGGLLARDLAHDRPHQIRQVITLGAACRLPTATTLAPLFHLTAPFYAPRIDVARLSRALPVPTTSIYSSEDGIIAWESCRDERVGVVAVDVGGTHFALSRNPRALRAMALRLRGE
jgi:pimeloyl-ACP methyl ester carboxylesterase